MQFDSLFEGEYETKWGVRIFHLQNYSFRSSLRQFVKEKKK